MNSAIGNTILTGSVAATSSARIIRLLRASTESR